MSDQPEKSASQQQGSEGKKAKSAVPNSTQGNPEEDKRAQGQQNPKAPEAEPKGRPPQEAEEKEDEESLAVLGKSFETGGEERNFLPGGIDPNAALAAQEAEQRKIRQEAGLERQDAEFGAYEED